MNNRVILAWRENSTLVSNWTEYLCVRSESAGTAVLEVCTYEVLAEWQATNEDESEIPIPETYDGKVVAGLDGEFLVGGDLSPRGEDSFSYRRIDLEAALDWANRNHFVLDGDARNAIERAAM